MLWSITRTHIYTGGGSLQGALFQSSALSRVMLQVDCKLTIIGCQQAIMEPRHLFWLRVSYLVLTVVNHTHPAWSLNCAHTFRVRPPDCGDGLYPIDKKYKTMAYYILTICVPSQYKVQNWGWANTKRILLQGMWYVRQNLATFGTNLVLRYKSSFTAPLNVVSVAPSYLKNDRHLCAVMDTSPLSQMQKLPPGENRSCIQQTAPQHGSTEASIKM